MKKLFVFMCVWFVVVAGGNGAAYDGIVSNGLDVVLIDGHEHSDIWLYTSDVFTGESSGLTGAGSSAGWVTPSIETNEQNRTQLVLSFASGGLPATTNVATVTVSHSRDGIRSFEVRGIRRSLNVVKLIDDPLRGHAYGIHQIGAELGALVRFDIGSTNVSGVQTLGRRPADLDLSNDGAMVVTVNSAEGTLMLVRLSDLQVTWTVPLPSFENWDVNVTTADVAWGEGSVIYYTDAKRDPSLHVYDRISGQLLQTVDAVGSGTGFGDFAVLPNKSMLFAWRQFGWSFGSLSSWVARYRIQADGTLDYLSQSLPENSFAMKSDPLNTPVLPTYDSSSVFVKGTLWTTNSLIRETRRFPQPIYAISAGGELAFSDSRIYDGKNGVILGDLPVETEVQSVASSLMKLVYFDPSDRQLKVFGFRHLVDPDLALGAQRPAGSSPVNRPATLGWNPLSGTQEYHVYYGKDPNQFSGTNSYLGKTSFPFIRLDSSIERKRGDLYYWRAVGVNSFEPVLGGNTGIGGITGDVGFRIADITFDRTRISEHAMEGQNISGDLQLTMDSPGSLSWDLTPEDSWISLSETQGTGSRVLTYNLNALATGPGVHSSSIAVRSGGQLLYRLPVELRVVRRNIVMIEPDRGGTNFYAVNIDHSFITNEAFLVSINGATEQLGRVVPIGRGVSDFAVHPVDDKIYVANSLAGQLTILDKGTLSNVHTVAFAPYGGVGSEGDVYAVAAGATGRIMLEEEDQHVYISLFDTVFKTNVSVRFEREGGGAFGGRGRFYFHGDNNSSGARVRRFDTYGDRLTEVASTRVDIVSYFGSRLVTVSDFGNRVFWNGGQFDGDLNLEQPLGAEVHATSADGRYAFGSTGLTDLDTGQLLLSNLVPSSARAFNRFVSKFAYSDGSNVAFFQITNVVREWPMLTGLNTNATRISVTWNDLHSETGYVLERSSTNTAGFQVLANLPANTTQFVDSNLLANTTYHYRIKASDGYSNSIYSPVLSIDSPVSVPQQPLSTPFQLSPLAGTNQITVRWNDVAGETGYRLERSRGDTNGWQFLATTAADTTQFLDTGLIAGANYHYRLAATNSTGASEFSNVRFSQSLSSPIVPASPVLAIVLVTTNSIAMVWSDVASVTDYVVERSDDTNTTWRVVASLPASSTNYLDTNVVANLMYSYRVQASNGIGSSDYSVPRSAELVEPPETPVLTSLSASLNLVWISWSDVADEDGYFLQRSLSSNGPWLNLHSVAANSTRSVDQSVTAGTTYYYRLLATNTLGGSSISMQQSVSVPLYPAEIGGVSTNGLVSYWSFDQPVGSRVVSEPYSGFNGVLSETGASIETNGIHGNALNLSRSLNGVMQAGDVLDLTNGNFTISCWFRTPAGESRDNTILIHKHVPGFRNGYFMGLNTTAFRLVRNKGYFYIGDVNQPVSHPISTADTLVSSSDVNDGNWHLMTVVHGNGTTKRLYVDGVLEDLKSSEGFTPNDSQFVLGGHGNGTFTGAFNGQIDEVRVYDRLLSPAEVVALYHRFVPPPPMETPLLSSPAFSSPAVQLTWSDVPGETNYVVERRLGEIGEWLVLTNRPADYTNAWDFAVGVGQTYWYRVSSQGPGGTSSPSAGQSITIPIFTLPTPTLSSPVSGTNSISLSWNAISNATSYRLERSVPPATNWSTVGIFGSGITNFLDGDVAPGTDYQYRLKASNLHQISDYSPPVTARLRGLNPPTLPMLTILSVTPATVSLAWSDQSNETYYELERSLGGISTWSRITVKGPNDTNHVDASVVRGNVYSYRVRAGNDDGVSLYSVPRIVNVPNPTTPAAPANLVAKPLYPGLVKLTWGDVTNETTFRLQKRTDGGSWEELVQLATDQLSHVDTNVVVGTRYHYRVFAVNSLGSSPPSNEDSIVPFAEAELLADDFAIGLKPGLWTSMSGGVVTNGSGFNGSPALYFHGTGERSVVTAPLDVSTGGSIVFEFRVGDRSAAPWDQPDSGSSVVLEYTVDEGQNWLSINLQAPLSHAAWTQVTIPIPNGAIGPNTCFRWRQSQHSSAGDNWAIDDVSIRGSLPAVPSPVTYVLAQAKSGREIVVAWIKSDRATTFRVERTTDSESWTTAALIAATKRSFVDGTVRPGTLYYYRVVAENAGGVAPAPASDSATTWTSLEHWNQRNHGDRNAGDLASMGALRPDGSRQILRYAFGLSLQENQRTMEADGDSGYPRIVFDRTRRRLCVQFVRRRANTGPGIAYRVEFSNDLVTWMPGGMLNRTDSIDAVWERVEYEDTVAGDGRLGRYSRVIVEVTD